MNQAQTARIRAEAAAARDSERARKAYERAQAADEKERKRLYLAKRNAEVDAANALLDPQVKSRQGCLAWHSKPMLGWIWRSSRRRPR